MPASGYCLLHARPAFPPLAVLEGFVREAARILHGPARCILERADGKLKSSDSHLNPYVLRVKVEMPAGFKALKFTLGITDHDVRRGRVEGNDHAYVQAKMHLSEEACRLAELAMDLWEASTRLGESAEALVLPAPPPPCACCASSSCRRMLPVCELPADAAMQ